MVSDLVPSVQVRASFASPGLPMRYGPRVSPPPWIKKRISAKSPTQRRFGECATRSGEPKCVRSGRVGSAMVAVRQRSPSRRIDDGSQSFLREACRQSPSLCDLHG
jgi:hypothetical protein